MGRSLRDRLELDDGDRSASLYAGVLLSATGLLAWVTGQPFVFPSLGPTAFDLATGAEADATDRDVARRVVGGHLVGALSGFAAHSLLAPGETVATVASPAAPLQLALVASGVLAVVCTSAGMFATDTVHPPACATTLIVGLGLLSRPLDVGIIAAAVVLLVGVHTVLRRGRRR